MGDEVGQGWTRKRGVNAQDQLHQLFVKMQNMLMSYNRSLNWTDSLIFKQGMNFGRSRIWIVIGSDSGPDVLHFLSKNLIDPLFLSGST